MSLKDSHRHPTEPLLEEDKDFYLSFLNKKLRNIRKKLEQIDDLLKRDQSALKREQLDKISSRPEVIKSVEHYENLKQIYYSAYKTAIEEGRAPTQERSMDRTQAKDQQAATSTQANSAPQSAESTSAVNTGTSDDLLRDALRKVVNLVSLSQGLSRGGLAGALEKEENPVSSEDIKSLEQFYQSVLVFGDNQAGVKIEDRVNQAVDKLVSYVKGEDQSAVEARTYKSLQETVERAVKTPSFRDIRPAHNTQTTSSPQKVVETKSNSDSNQKEEPRTLQSSFQESSEHEIQAAPVVQPDFDDSSRSPVQNVPPREPKMVKFVDEIEKDLLAHPREDTKPVSQERRTSILKEPKHTGDHSATEKPQENGEEEVQEQRSFKRKRFSNESGNNAGKGKYVGGKQYNKGGNSWQKKTGDHEDDGYGNDKTYKKDRYESNDYYKPRGRNNQYQYTEYVEKKSL